MRDALEAKRLFIHRSLQDVSCAGSPAGSTSRNAGTFFHCGTGGVWPSRGT
jgi:hypothetical protein